MEEYKEFSLKELAEEAEDLGIEKVRGKNNPAKPTKQDYLVAIELFKTHGNVGEETEEVEEVVVVKQTVKPRQSAAKLRKLDLFRKIEVIVHDNQDSQTKDKDELFPVSWGNRLGVERDLIALNGEPQFVRKGAISALEDISMSSSKRKDNGSGIIITQSKRFFVKTVGGAGMTEDRLEDLKAKQKVQSAKNG